MQYLYILWPNCIFLESLKGHLPLLPSVSTTYTMGVSVGDGYTPLLFIPSSVMILTFPGLPCAISSRHKGENDKYSTTEYLQFLSLFPSPKEPVKGPLVPSALLLRPHLFGSMKESCRGQQRWWQWWHPNPYEPGFILSLNPGSLPSPCCIFPGENDNEDVIIVVDGISDLRISSIWGINGVSNAASGPTTGPLTRYDDRWPHAAPILVAPCVVKVAKNCHITDVALPHIQGLWREVISRGRVIGKTGEILITSLSPPASELFVNRSKMGLNTPPYPSSSHSKKYGSEYCVCGTPSCCVKPL